MNFLRAYQTSALRNINLVKGSRALMNSIHTTLRCSRHENTLDSHVKKPHIQTAKNDLKFIGHNFATFPAKKKSFMTGFTSPTT